MDFVTFLTQTFYPFAAILTLFRGRTTVIGMLLLLVFIDGGKRVVGEARPDGSDNRSFPSGHAATAWYLVAMYEWNPAVLAWAVAVTWTRVLLRRHYVHDVMAGGLVGILAARSVKLLAPR